MCSSYLNIRFARVIVHGPITMTCSEYHNVEVDITRCCDVMMTSADVVSQ